MAVTREYVCLAHGDFDASVDMDTELAPCPHGCGLSMVQRVFRTAPAFHRGNARMLDTTIQGLMQEQGVTDVNHRGGDGMRMTDWRASKRASEAMQMICQGGANKGSDMNQFFAPVSAMGKHSNGAPPSVVKDDHGNTVIPGTGVALSKPGTIVAGRYDGSSAGLPAGDA